MIFLKKKKMISPFFFPSSVPYSSVVSVPVTEAVASVTATSIFRRYYRDISKVTLIEVFLLQ